jgi:hypothetical protein
MENEMIIIFCGLSVLCEKIFSEITQRRKERKVLLVTV